MPANSRWDLIQRLKALILHDPLLDAFEKLRKATTSLVRSVRPSVSPHGTTELPLDGFSLDYI